METRDMKKKGLYVGTGMGLILFVLVGFFPGSVIGGIVGLKLAGSLLGSPVSSSLLPRLIVAFSMITGILVSAVSFVFGMGLLGWIGGYVLEAVASSRLEPQAAEALKR